MLPPLDRKWTWEAWAAAQIAADPLKSPNTIDEVTMIVHRAEAAGIRPYEMEQALQVPDLEIKRMLRAAPPPDPWRTEMKELVYTLRVEALLARIQGLPFPGPQADKHKRLRVMVSMTESQLNGVTELAPPEAVAQMLQAIEAR